MKVIIKEEYPIIQITGLFQIAFFQKKPELELLLNPFIKPQRTNLVLSENERMADPPNGPYEDIFGKAASGTISKTAPEKLTFEGIQTIVNLPKAGCQNLINYCHSLGLCTQNGVISDLGRDCFETGLFPIPEEGVFKLWVINNHPILGNEILHVEHVPYDFWDRDFSKYQELPAWFDELLGKEFFSDIDKGVKFSVKGALNPKELGGRPIGLQKKNSSLCTWTWEIDLLKNQNNYCFEGSLDGLPNGKRTFSSKGQSYVIPDFDYETLLKSLFPDYQKERNFLPVEFDGKSTDFVRRQIFPSLRIQELGNVVFNNVRVEGVNVGPCDEENAKKWARNLWLKNLQTLDEYVSSRVLKKRWKDLKSGTPLEEFKIPVLKIESVLKRLEERESWRSFWFVSAPKDLHPEFFQNLRSENEPPTEDGKELQQKAW